MEDRHEVSIAYWLASDSDPSIPPTQRRFRTNDEALTKPDQQTIGNHIDV